MRKGGKTKTRKLGQTSARKAKSPARLDRESQSISQPIASNPVRELQDPLVDGHGPSEPWTNRAAVIDIGSNSIRLVVAQREQSHNASAKPALAHLVDARENTRLAAGLDASGELSEAVIAKSVRAVGRLVKAAQLHHAGQIKIVATAAVRDASNKETFLARIKHATGLDVEVIDGQREAMLALVSATPLFDQRIFARKVCAVVDLGGGSTEIVITRKGKIEAVTSMQLGAVRLTERFADESAICGIHLKKTRKAVDQAIGHALATEIVGTSVEPADAAVGPGGQSDLKTKAKLRPKVAAKSIAKTANVSALVATGGTVTSLALMELLEGQEQEADLSDRLAISHQVRGMVIKRARVRAWLKDLAEMDENHRATINGMSKDRAQIIVAGIMILHRTMKALGAKKLIVHPGSIRDALLEELLGPDGRG